MKTTRDFHPTQSKSRTVVKIPNTLCSEYPSSPTPWRNLEKERFGQSKQRCPWRWDTKEVLKTVLTEVEEILNGKTVGHVSSDISHPGPVTPDLLTERLDSQVSQVGFWKTELLSNRPSEVLADCFWSHCTKSYLPNIQLRQKWTTERTNLLPSSVVTVMDPDLPQALWPIGQIRKTFPGTDVKVRVAGVAINTRLVSRQWKQEEEGARTRKRVEMRVVTGVSFLHHSHCTRVVSTLSYL